jgi:hypothetical protein
MNKTEMCRLLEDKHLKISTKLRILEDELMVSNFNLKQCQDKVDFINTEIKELNKCYGKIVISDNISE